VSQISIVRDKIKRFVRSPLLYLSPAVIYIAAFSVYPLVYSLYLSFHEYDRVTGQLKFVGIQNFLNLCQNPLFLKSLTNTLILATGAVAIEFVLGLAMALLLWGKIRGRAIFRTAFIIPMIITPVVVAIMWKFLLWPAWGLFGYIFRSLGMAGVNWLSSEMALISIMVVDIWEWTPFVFLVLQSGLMSLPIETFEAARIDGARRWQTFRSITLPYLMPTITVAVLFRLMDVLKIFDPVWVLTAGGPGTSSYTLSLFIYQEYMSYSHPGLGSAASYIMLIIVVVIINIYMKYIYKR